ncbi:IS4 family transposase [Natrialba swarupiae]|uniref:IS4 family transposase n=1 Tax=Natrialba swarupiae TaxID=2448032 RepID=A0A5D5AHJ8_9EURY|nr:IS4 family transposase [Natrialba swarupiae]TYT60307.1 IS4 family transposase [Natrialba swarupiae]
MDRWLRRICQELNNLIPPQPVRDHSRATGLIERSRHINPTPFLWSFLVGTTEPDGSVSAAHDYYKTFTGDDVAYSSIQQWITPELTKLLTDLVNYVSVELGRTESSLGGRFSRFQDVFIADATICTLSPEAIDAFPGYGNDHAGAKLHVVESLASVAPFLDSITSARTQETTQLEIDTWVEDSLTLFDLGYLDYDRLGRIEDNDGWFISRLNADANPHVIKEPRTVRGNSINLEGTHLQEVLPDLYRQTIDVTARVGADQDDPHLPYDLRVIGVRHEGDDDAPAYRDDVEADHEYHLYATNLPRNGFAPREIAALYSNRWSVETVIQELKEVFGLEFIPVRRESAVRCFLLAGVLMLLLSRHLLRRGGGRGGPPRKGFRGEKNPG